MRGRGDARRSEALSDGSAAELFARMVLLLGGPADCWIEPVTLALRGRRSSCRSRPTQRASVASCDTRDMGVAVIELGGGRTQAGSGIDHRVGFDRLLPLGTRVGEGRPRSAASTRSTQDEALRPTAPARTATRSRMPHPLPELLRSSSRISG